MNIIKKATAALTAAAVLAVGSAMPAIAATTGDLNRKNAYQTVFAVKRISDRHLQKIRCCLQEIPLGKSSFLFPLVF